MKFIAGRRVKHMDGSGAIHPGRRIVPRADDENPFVDDEGFAKPLGKVVQILSAGIVNLFDQCSARFLEYRHASQDFSLGISIEEFAYEYLAARETYRGTVRGTKQIVHKRNGIGNAQHDVARRWVHQKHFPRVPGPFEVL